VRERRVGGVVVPCATLSRRGKLRPGGHSRFASNGLCWGVAIPPEVLEVARVALAEFCAEHSSAPGADRLRYAYEFETNAAVLLVQKPAFMNPQDWVSTPVARFRYSEARSQWSLYWFDADAKWHRVSNVNATNDIRVLLQTVVSDPLGVFWS